MTLSEAQVALRCQFHWLPVALNLTVVPHPHDWVTLERRELTVSQSWRWWTWMVQERAGRNVCDADVHHDCGATHASAHHARVLFGLPCCEGTLSITLETTTPRKPHTPVKVKIPNQPTVGYEHRAHSLTQTTQNLA